MTVALPGRIVRGVREATRSARLLLAVKTALAVGVAWAIAPHMPGVTDAYPYYAPLGALVSMYPTLMGSAKTGAQTLLGLAAGIGLATLVLVTVGPNWWSIPVIVGIGTLLSGTGWFGAGREYVPMAALFVLIIGGQDADSYSLGYLVQMGVGVLVGLLVNVLIAPQLSSAAAGSRVDALERQLADHLRQIGAAVTAPEPVQHDEWTRNIAALEDTVGDVRRALADADESRKGNPRALLHRRDVRRDHVRLQVLETLAFHVRDISAVLADAVWERPGSLALSPALEAPIEAACAAVAEAIEHGRSVDAEHSAAEHRTTGIAARAVRELVQTVNATTVNEGSSMGPGVFAAMHLRRILMQLRAPSD